MIAAAGAVTVTVVQLDLDAPPADWADWRLSAAEVRRAERFRSERDRRRFLCRRRGLRAVLAEALGVGGGTVVLAEGEFGKPVLGPDHAGSGLRFNTSSSGGLGLVAMAWGRDVGVDVERQRAHDDLDTVARRFFSTAERRLLLGLEGTARLEAFYTCWTMKEAFVKARGDGLSLPLDAFDVDPGATTTSALQATRWDPGEAGRWQLQAVPAAPGYHAAVAYAV